MWLEEAESDRVDIWNEHLLTLQSWRTLMLPAQVPHPPSAATIHLWPEETWDPLTWWQCGLTEFHLFLQDCIRQCSGSFICTSTLVAIVLWLTCWASIPAAAMTHVVVKAIIYGELWAKHSTESQLKWVWSFTAICALLWAQVITFPVMSHNSTPCLGLSEVCFSDRLSVLYSAKTEVIVGCVISYPVTGTAGCTFFKWHVMVLIILLYFKTITVFAINIILI